MKNRAQGGRDEEREKRRQAEQERKHRKRDMRKTLNIGRVDRTNIGQILQPW